MTPFMLIDASRISSPSVPCFGWLKANPGCQVPRPLLSAVHSLDSLQEAPTLLSPMEGMQVPPPQVCQGPEVLFMESPEFVLARLWVASTSSQPSLQRLAAGRDGQRGVCCQQSSGQHKVAGSTRWRAAREAWQLHRERKAIRGRKSSGISPRLSWQSPAWALLPTGPHWTPKEDLWGDSGHQVLN